jgi:ribose-phosphate pyrophosphokinase
MAGPASQDFANKLAKRLNFPLLGVTATEFPDKEVKFTFHEKLNGLEVLLVQSTYPPADKRYMELFFASHHMSQEGARVHAVIPYLGFARQGKVFLPGEIATLGIIAHLLRSVGVTRVTTVDMHSAEGLGLFSMPTYSVSAIPALARYVKANVKLKDPVMAAPDAGSLLRTEAFAALYGAKFVQFSKHRDKVTGRIRVEADKLQVKGRDVVIVDDVITTGGTVAAATELLRKADAGRIVAATVHAVLIGDTYDNLMKAGVDEIIGTNTVPSRVSKVDATEPVAKYLQTLTGG